MGSSADFSLKVWGVTIFISPFFIDFIGLSPLYFYAIGYGIVCSLPALIFFVITASFINKTTLHLFSKKLVLAVIGFTITFLTFQITGLKEDIPYIPYLVILVVSIFIFKLNPPEKPVEDYEMTGDN